MTVASTNGYSVIIKVTLVTIVPSSTSCPYGYNYNVVLNYTVSFTGTNIPSSLYTLQGNLVCNTNQSLFYSLPTGGGTGSYTTTSNPYITSDATNVYTSHPGCTAATVSNLNCGSITVQINGPGISNQTINCPANSPLPIGLLYFTGARTYKNVVLRWETESEKNNKYFTVEKSLDGFNWVKMENIDGAGTSSISHSYTYTDETSSADLNYYRLKQTDLDGTATYAPVIYIPGEATAFTVSNLRPNPTQNSFKFLTDAPASGIASYRILSDMGTAVKEGSFPYNIGQTETELSVVDCISGFYLLEIRIDDQHVCYRKLVKL